LNFHRRENLKTRIYLERWELSAEANIGPEKKGSKDARENYVMNNFKTCAFQRLLGG